MTSGSTIVISTLRSLSFTVVISISSPRLFFSVNVAASSSVITAVVFTEILSIESIMADRTLGETSASLSL